MGWAKIGVAVEPPLLADLLVRALWGPEREVSRHVGSSACDLAVVSPQLAGKLHAPSVICLPDDEGGSGWGTFATRTGARPVSIDGVDAIIALVTVGLSG